jgi:hypothetical protein
MWRRCWLDSPSAGEGAKVVLGSGTTLIAAQRLHRGGIGVEIDPAYFALAVRRVTQECQLEQLTLEDAAPAETLAERRAVALADV